MAGKGNTTPKPAAQRRRTNKVTGDRIVTEDDEVRGPDLPFGFDWPAQTRIWWDNWRRSGQAQEFSQTDWDFLLDTAMIHAEFWSGNTAVGPELRLRVAKMGATKGDRIQLRVSLEPQPSQTPPADTPRKERRLKVVDGAAG